MAEVTVRVRQTVSWSAAAAAAEREGGRKLLIRVEATTEQSPGMGGVQRSLVLCLLGCDNLMNGLRQLC